MNTSFKRFMDSIHKVKETNLTVEKEALVLVLPYLVNCKLQILFKNKTRLGNNVRFKDRIPEDLTSSVVYKFQCRFCDEAYYGEYTRI